MDIKDFPFECTACGFHFRDKETAKECEWWCTEKGVCNSEIGMKALEMQRNCCK